MLGYSHYVMSCHSNIQISLTKDLQSRLNKMKFHHFTCDRTKIAAMEGVRKSYCGNSGVGGGFHGAVPIVMLPHFSKNPMQLRKTVFCLPFIVFILIPLNREAAFLHFSTENVCEF